MGMCHEEGYGRLLCLLMCFCCSCFSASEADSGSDWKHGLSGLSAPCLLSPRCHRLTWFSLCPAELPCILGPLEFCAHGAFECYMWIGQQKMGLCTLHPFPLLVTCPVVPLNFLKSTISKIKRLTVSRWRKHETKHRALLGTESCGTACAHGAAPAPPVSLCGGDGGLHSVDFNLILPKWVS